MATKKTTDTGGASVPASPKIVKPLARLPEPLPENAADAKALAKEKGDEVPAAKVGERVTYIVPNGPLRGEYLPATVTKVHDDAGRSISAEVMFDPDGLQPWEHPVCHKAPYVSQERLKAKIRPGTWHREQS